MKKKSISVKAVISLLLFIVIIPFTPILISRNWTWLEGWLYGGISLLTVIISRYIAEKHNPGILAERAKFMQAEDAKTWDKVLAPLVALGGGLMPIFAGLDAAFWHSVHFINSVKIIALIIFIFGMIFSSYALIVNSYFSGMVRIQKDRGQKVISNGPYSIVRHPGYTGIILTYFTTPIILDSIWTFIPVILITILLFIRTGLEDKTLVKELDGYKEYTKKVKYRLLPGVW